MMKDKMKYTLTALILLFLTPEFVMSQKVEPLSTFGSSRVALTQSVETTPKGILIFEIQHQFGPVNSGIQEFFGLDQATTRLGFTYGITDWLSIGIGRSGLYKTYDGSLKMRLLTQSEGKGAPLSLSYFGNMGINTTSWNYDNIPAYFSHRLSFVNQLLAARRFGDHLSVQMSADFIHRNFVESRQADNDVWAAGFAARYLFGDKFSATFDYHYVFSSYTAANSENSLTIGLNILTAGHVFSLVASNSFGFIEQMYIPDTRGSWLKGDIHFGFTISRSFTIVEPDYFE